MWCISSRASAHSPMVTSRSRDAPRYSKIRLHLFRPMSKLPLSVRITDVIHRATVLGLFGITAVGTGSILFNIYANSDYSKMNSRKLAYESPADTERPEESQG